MASIYMTKTEGTGIGYDYVRAAGFSGVPHITLMIDQQRSNNCIVLSPVDGVVSPSSQVLKTAPTMAELKTQLQTTVPTQNERNAMDRYATGAGSNMVGLTSAQVTFWDCLVYLSRQVNPVADLDVTFASFV